MMGLSVNKILDSKVTGLFVFGVTGLGKVVSDYKKATDDNKGLVLTRDSLILGGTAVGIGLYSVAKGQVLKHNIFDKNSLKGILKTIKSSNIYRFIPRPSIKITNPIKKGTKAALTIFKDCVDNTLMLGCGIMGAIGADYGIRYSHIEKNKKLRALNKYGDSTFNTIYNYENKLKSNFSNNKLNQDLEDVVGSDVKNNIYSRVTDLRAMRMFGSTMAGIQGFEVIEEKTFKKRMKHATGCLISNSVIPLFFLSTSSRLTKNMKTIVRAPIIFTSLVGGTMYSNRLINNLDKGKGILQKAFNKLKLINKDNTPNQLPKEYILDNQNENGDLL